MVCCFIGHRKIEITEELINKLKYLIEDLITNHDINAFLFGSKSEFNSLCHEIVTGLKKKYHYIKRVAYTCKSESCTLEKDKLKWEKLYSVYEKKFVGFEEEFEHKTKYTSGRASYVERNQAMIDDSDYCIFYYDENYKPPTRKHKKSDATKYQPNSGTSLSFKYAKQRNKNIFNILTPPYLP